MNAIQVAKVSPTAARSSCWTCTTRLTAPRAVVACRFSATRSGDEAILFRFKGGLKHGLGPRRDGLRSLIEPVEHDSSEK